MTALATADTNVAPASSSGEMAAARTAPTVRGPQPSFADKFGTWTLGVPYPLLFIAGAASGILLACLIVLCSHRNPSPSAVVANVGQPVAAAAATAVWQPNVVTIRPADPMFDPPPFIAEPSPLAQTKAAPAAKKPATHHAPRHPATKRASRGRTP